MDICKMRSQALSETCRKGVALDRFCPVSVEGGERVSAIAIRRCDSRLARALEEVWGPNGKWKLCSRSDILVC